LSLSKDKKKPQVDPEME
jgi:hypothetical protein